MQDAHTLASRFLVIAPQGLGDSLEATPFIAALKGAHPHDAIDVVVTRRGPKELFEGLSHLVDDVMLLPYWDLGLSGFAKELFRHCWKRRYEAAFLMYPAARLEYQLLMSAFRTRRRFAHRYFTPSLRNGLWLSSDLVDIASGKHNVLQNMNLLSAAGIPFKVPDCYVVPESWKAAEPAPRRVAIHVGTLKHDGLDARRWPLQHFETVIRRAVDAGFDVSLIMGPAEREETLALKEKIPQVGIVEGTLAHIARFLSTSSLVLTNDNGIGHLAAGVGAPVISLFGPTDPARHRPYGPSAVALRPSDCPPCFDARLLNTQCALNINYRCLREDMTVNAVIEAMNRVLDAHRLQPL